MIALALGLAACGDDDSSESEAEGADSTALREAFGERAEEAYTAADKSRADDFGPGVVLDECFVAYPETASAIGEAAGDEDAAFGDNNFLQGPPDEEEHLGCATEAEPGERPAFFMLTVGTTLVTRDQFLERLIRNNEEATEIEGEAEGLDPASVLAIDGDGISQYAWVQDDFFVGVGGPTDKLSSEEGFAALSAAVDGVDTTLLGDG